MPVANLNFEFGWNSLFSQFLFSISLNEVSILISEMISWTVKFVKMFLSDVVLIAEFVGFSIFCYNAIDLELHSSI